jgi:hypothetical protein
MAIVIPFQKLVSIIIHLVGIHHTEVVPHFTDCNCYNAISDANFATALAQPDTTVPLFCYVAPDTTVPLFCYSGAVRRNMPGTSQCHMHTMHCMHHCAVTE